MAISASDLSDRQRRLLLALFDKTIVAENAPPPRAGVRGNHSTIFGLTKRFNGESAHALEDSRGWGATMKALERLGLVEIDMPFRQASFTVEAWMVSAEGYELATTELDSDWVSVHTPITIAPPSRNSALAERRECPLGGLLEYRIHSDAPH